MGADRCAPIGHTCARGWQGRRHPVVSVCGRSSSVARGWFSHSLFFVLLRT